MKLEFEIYRSEGLESERAGVGVESWSRNGKLRNLEMEWKTGVEEESLSWSGKLELV